MHRTTVTKYTGRKAKITDSHQPLELASRAILSQSEHKRKLSKEFEDASSKPDAKRLKAEPTAISEGESPVQARSGQSDQLRAKAQPSVSQRKQIEEHDGIAHAPGPYHFPENVEGDSVIPVVGATVHDGVDFGLLECIGDYVPPYRLRTLSKQSECTELMVGCDISCDITVAGHDVGLEERRARDA
ncbi:hypothetical protein FRC00_006679 [Tulasnella sp. 408]|nr:hypothetical protein FRC00_006679 [Tulasnella sp. 408]